MEIGFPAKTVIVLLLIEELSHDMIEDTCAELNSKRIFTSYFHESFFNPIKFNPNKNHDYNRKKCFWSKTFFYTNINEHGL